MAGQHMTDVTACGGGPLRHGAEAELVDGALDS